MDYDKLKAELAKPAYAAMTAQEAADSLNAATVTKQGPVPMRLVLRWSARWDGIFKLREASAGGNKDHRRLADAALQMLSSPHLPEFDLSDPELMTMLAGLVSLGVLTQAEADDLKALGVQTISRAAELGLPVVQSSDVEIARGVRPLVQLQGVQ